MKILLFANRVICNAMNLVRCISSLRNPKMRYVWVRVGMRPNWTIVAIPVPIDSRGSLASQNKPKHNPQ